LYTDLNAHSSFKLLNTTQSVPLQTGNRSNDRVDMKIRSEKDEKYEVPILGNIENETEAKTDLKQDKIPTIDNKLNETETELIHIKVPTAEDNKNETKTELIQIKVPTVEDNKNETETEFIQNKVQAIDNNQIKTVADLFTLDIFSDIDQGTKQIEQSKSEEEKNAEVIPSSKVQSTTKLASSKVDISTEILSSKVESSTKLIAVETGDIEIEDLGQNTLENPLYLPLKLIETEDLFEKPKKVKPLNDLLKTVISSGAGELGLQLWATEAAVKRPSPRPVYIPKIKVN